MGVIDKIAPIKEIRVKGNSKPWFDGSIRDKLKKKSKKTTLQVKKLIKSKKCDFIKDQLKANIAKPSKLWKVLKSLGFPQRAVPMPRFALRRMK